jgi:indole-3-glycerol phosphate synthase
LARQRRRRHSMLVGETLMRAKNVPEKMRELLLRE